MIEFIKCILFGIQYHFDRISSFILRGIHFDKGQGHAITYPRNRATLSLELLFEENFVNRQLSDTFFILCFQVGVVNVQVVYFLLVFRLKYPLHAKNTPKTTKHVSNLIFNLVFLRAMRKRLRSHSFKINPIAKWLSRNITRSGVTLRDRTGMLS